jgi:hypothetical protein
MAGFINVLKTSNENSRDTTPSKRGAKIQDINLNLMMKIRIKMFLITQSMIISRLQDPEE